MNATKLKTATVDQLLAAYVESSCIQADPDTPYKVANKHYNVVESIFKELKTRGSDAYERILELQDDPRDEVRFWVGAHALEFAPVQGELLLQSIASNSGSKQKFDANLVLQKWRSGELKFN